MFGDQRWLRHVTHPTLREHVPGSSRSAGRSTPPRMHHLCGATHGQQQRRSHQPRCEMNIHSSEDATPTGGIRIIAKRCCGTLAIAAEHRKAGDTRYPFFQHLFLLVVAGDTILGFPDRLVTSNTFPAFAMGRVEKWRVGPGEPPFSSTCGSS